MSYYGYADFDRPIDFDGGRIYYAYGTGAFALTPLRCTVANADDGRVNFRLDLVRGAIPGDPNRAFLEFRLVADYATDRALTFLRKDHPGATLLPAVLTDWALRLGDNPATSDLPQELRDGVKLASNGLGTARLLMPLTIEAGLLLESIVNDGRTPLPMIATARMEGVSPRVPAVVRFRASDLLDELDALLSADGTIGRQALVNFFNRDLAALPMDVSGTVAVDQRIGFAETMADRIIDRFGAYAPFSSGELDPLITLPTGAVSPETDIIWSLSEPFLTSRPIVMSFDLLADIRHLIQNDTDGAFAIFHTSVSLPTLGLSTVTSYCNLPTERIGVAALGATLTFPANPPDRPQDIVKTVEFAPPDDAAKIDVRLAPTEEPVYRVSTFAVMTDAQGVRQIDGPELERSGPTLWFGPDDFPLDFALVDIGPDLADQASLTGACRYERNGAEYLIPFTLDRGRLSASIAVPRDRTSTNISCTASARNGSGVLYLGPFDALQVRLNLASFPEYGMHETAIECEFDGRVSVYAIDLMADGENETPGNLTVLAFTPEQPVRRYAWFARSPFSPGFRYRPHRDDGTPAAWRRVLSPAEHLVIRPEATQPAQNGEVKLNSESGVRLPGGNGREPRSERGRPIRRPEPESGETGSLPISPEPEPTDLLFYTDPSSPERKLVLPRYALGVQTASGRQEYRLSMAQQGATSTLTVHLLRGPAPEIADQARDAGLLPHEVSIRLEYLASPPYTARKTLLFEDVTRNGADVEAVCTFASLEERDEVYRALTDPTREARLVVQRSVDVAVPQVLTIDPIPLNNLGNFPIVDVLPPRPKPGWFQEVPIKPDPKPNWAVTDFIVSPVTTNLTSSFATLPPEKPINTGLMTTSLVSANVASTAMLAGRFESTTLRPRGRNNLLANDPGVFVIDDWFTKVHRAVFPVPVLAFTGRENSDSFVRCLLSITNWNEFTAEYFQPSPDLPPCGKNTQASRTWVDIFDADTDARLYGFCALSDPANLKDLWFAAQPGSVPARVYVQLVDRLNHVTHKSNVVETSKPKPVDPTFVRAHRDLDDVVAPAPFAFPPALHGYMFQGIQPGSGDGRLVRFRYQWLGTFHTYLQDAARPEVVYCFPDSFRIARREEPPFTPFITVRVAGQGGATDADVVFDYIVAPHTNPDRLMAARASLLADPQFGQPDVQFQPFATGDVRFFIDRPAQQGTVREERTGVALVLQGAIKDTLVMKLPDFQLLFDAMHRNTASLFLGRIEIDVPGGETEVIPFSARMTELEGNLFVFSSSANADGGVDVTIANAIESPVRIEALPATISRDGQKATAAVAGSSFPVERLDPGATLNLSVRADTPLDGTGAAEVAFNLSAVTVLPDPALILDSILDRTTLQYFDTITVKAIAGLFTPIEGRPADQIVVILVEFEGGGTAELNGSTLESQVRIDYPIDDVILRRNVDTSYRYTVTIVRADGRQERDPEPRQGTARTFFVSVNK